MYKVNESGVIIDGYTEKNYKFDDIEIKIRYCEKDGKYGYGININTKDSGCGLPLLPNEIVYTNFTKMWYSIVGMVRRYTNDKEVFAALEQELFENQQLSLDF